MLISNIWGIWPEERPLDDKASPVSLGPSYAVCTPATGRTAAPFPQQHLHQSFSLPTLTALLIALALWKQPSGGTSGTVRRCESVLPQGFGMLNTLSLSFDQLFTFFGKMSIRGLGSIFTRVFTLLLLSSDSSVWNSPVDPSSGLQVSLPKP